MGFHRRASEAPDELLERWTAGMARGRALDLGAGAGESAAWLARQGFSVDAVEHDRGAVGRLRRLRRVGRLQVHAVDLREFPYPSETHVLILALAVLHFVPRRAASGWPGDCPGLCGRS